MKQRILLSVGACLLAVLVAGCAASTGGGGSDRSWLTSEEIDSVDVSTLYDVVQRLRPRWLDVRATRAGFGGGGGTGIYVFQDRTLLGGVEHLRELGKEAAVSLQYMPGSRAQGELRGLSSRHVEGAIIVHTR